MIDDQNKENAKKIADKYIKADGTPVDAAFDNVIAFRSPQEEDKADETKTLADLAALSPLDYDKERKAAAERLGVSVGAIDRAVRETKREGFKGQGRPLELPETRPWHDPITGAELLNDMCAAIRRYVVLPEGAVETMALWAIHTHAFDSFAVSPRLAFTAPEMQCGKTTALNVVGEMTARPLSTENITTSAVFRTIEIARPTLLIDEADTFLKHNDELRGILNSGHRKGGSIIRTVGDDYEPRQFSTWGADRHLDDRQAAGDTSRSQWLITSRICDQRNGVEAKLHGSNPESPMSAWVKSGHWSAFTRCPLRGARSRRSVACLCPTSKTSRGGAQRPSCSRKMKRADRGQRDEAAHPAAQLA